MAEIERVIYEFGKFSLDVHDRTLFAAGEPLRLPAKEFDTLLILVENNGRALSKEEMMSAIWPDTFVEESNLAKYVSRLRKILNVEGEQFIETLPKHGYRFTADLRKTMQPSNKLSTNGRPPVKELAVEVDREIGPLGTVRLFRGRLVTAPRLVALGLAVLLGAFAIWLWKGRSRAAPSTTISTIAVLPLRPLTLDENDKALGLGLTDSLITKLGSLRQVVVRPTSAVAPFVGAPQDSIAIGRKLNVDAVLEGTIQRSEGRLRVNARLLRTDSGAQVWTETFDEPGTEIFALQDALSNKIGQTLAFALTNQENAELARHQTGNSEAYEKYLRGRFYQTQGNVYQGLEQSSQLYEQAIALDPNFADAHAGLASVYVRRYNFGILAADTLIPKAREELNRALLLNPNLAYAHTTAAEIEFMYDRDWPTAEKSLRRALELNPHNADAYFLYGWYLTALGRFDQALPKLEQARELNPLSAIVQTDIGLLYQLSRRYPQAIENYKKVIAGNPNFSLPRWLLGESYEAIGEEDRAFDLYVEALRLEGHADFAKRLQSVRQSAGKQAAYRIWLDADFRIRKEGYFSALIIASVYAKLKDREQTLAWLEKALAEHEPVLWQIRYVPTFDFVRDDARFQSVLQKEFNGQSLE